MTNAEKIAIVKGMSGEANDDTISAFLLMAGETIYRYADPYGKSSKEKILDTYGATQAKAAAYYLNKRGADGQKSHTENGISRSYENGDLPDSLLREITPICGSTT